MGKSGEQSTSLIRSSGEQLSTLTGKLAELAELRATTVSDIEAVHALSIPPAQITRMPGAGLNDYFARVGGGNTKKAFVYRDGKMVETDMNGEDVMGTYDLRLKQLKLDGDFELDSMLRELKNKEGLLTSLELQGDKEDNIRATRNKIEELSLRMREMRPSLGEERQKLKEAIMSIPIGTVLFISIQNAEELYPVVVVEDDGLKWVEVLTDIPNGLVNGGWHRAGFHIPLRNYTRGGSLYMPVGMRADDTVLDAHDVPRLEDENLGKKRLT